MKSISRFVVIDDDPVNNALCKMVIKMAVGKIDIKTFTLPEKGFEYIETEYSKNGNESTSVILLDLNMPLMSGWEFLERFDSLDEIIKKQLEIYILSSSVDPRDKARAGANKNVADYIVKPLTKEIILEISEEGRG
ncbi:MAG TPA: response regulator [Ignavibacteriaceae bacterium]|nr:response regulator [Ignavibacteriaceae bacterium]